MATVDMEGGAKKRSENCSVWKLGRVKLSEDPVTFEPGERNRLWGELVGNVQANPGEETIDPDVTDIIYALGGSLPRSPRSGINWRMLTASILLTNPI